MTMLKKLLRKFNENEQGVITLELIVLMPFMVLWIVGSNAFFDAFKTYLRASKATYTAVDLVSRQDEIGPNFVTNVGSVFKSIVDADGANATMVVSSIRMWNGDLEVVWSLSGSGGGSCSGGLGTIPTQFIPNLQDGESIVLIQTEVPFIPIFSWGNLAAKTFTNTVAVTPRYGPLVGCQSSF
jgi:hypothetical protein